MRFHGSVRATATATLLAVSPAVAQWNNLTAGNFRLAQSGYSGLIAGLDKEPALPNRRVADVIGDTNHKAPTSTPTVKYRVDAYTWEVKDGYDDLSTTLWYPQSLTTTYDSDDSGEFEGDVVQLVSWHSDNYDGGKRGARISFVNANDPADRSYRNVLLVVPNGAPDGVANFQAISSLHTGGMFWYGNLLYVVYAEGFLVFDLNKIYEVDIGEGIGRVGDRYQAYNFKYVMPQVQVCTWIPQDGVKKPTFSFVALDRTSTPHQAITGGFDVDEPTRLIHFDMDPETHLLATGPDNIATANYAVQHEVDEIQGATMVDGKYYLTEGGHGKLITFSWMDGEQIFEDVYPGVPQDVSYQKDFGLWSVMEMPGVRDVSAIDITALG